MNIKAISLVLGLSITGNLAAAERMCFGQVPVETSTDLVAKITVAENNYFTDNKCKHFFSYYEKHVDFTQAECEANKEQLSLDKGYAPFGVFLRGTDSTSKGNISSYDWEIKNIATNEILTTYNAFNASYVFDEPGEYSAILTITGKDGSTSTATKDITVWARDGKNYFVDSAIGDDRYDGLSQTADNTCDANTAVLNSCAGPWKTATRALGEMAPYQVTNYPNGEYTADNICSNTETVNIVRYNAGNFKLYRDSPYLEAEVKKDMNGDLLPVLPTQLCLQTAAKRQTVLRPGDNVLFNRGQQFNLETGLNTLYKYTANNNGTVYNYERLDIQPITSIAHWSKALGIHFSAYGTGPLPLIKNTGKASHSAIQLKGVGMFGFSMSNLEFTLESEIPNPFKNRATFVTAYQNPINSVFKNITVEKMDQGIVYSNGVDAQGLFIFDSHLYDSNQMQLYTGNSLDGVALVNNTLDYSANHLIYSHISHGLVYNNTLSRPAFGRTAYRLAGGTFDNPNNYVWISDNKVSGWIDPRTAAEFGKAFADGKRYNYTLLDIAPNNTSDLAIHDVVLTRNIVSNAETFLSLGASENITISNNIFKSADSFYSPRIKLNAEASQRPLVNINIINNKFIDSAPQINAGHVVTSFINLNNYNQKKCNDQFNNSQLKITKNAFYVTHNQRRIFDFTPLKQGKDLTGSILPDLTLDQAESFLNKELMFSQNQMISPDNTISTVQIGGNRLSFGDTKETNIDWSQYYQGTDYRLYNSLSQFTQSTGDNPWLSSNSTSIETLLASNYAITSITTATKLTWDDLIAYAQENNISPSDLESMILNQVLAENPSYSGPNGEYSADISTLNKVGNWFASISSQIGQLFTTGEDQYRDAKNLASKNNIPASKVMQDINKI